MEVHAFIFNWKGHFDRACQLESEIGKLVRTTVINSEESREAIRKKWCHLGDEAYFAAQWNKALELFEGDALFHVQADATIQNPQKLIERAMSAMKRHDAGVFEPNIDYTSVAYPKNRLQSVAPKLMVVPRTDCTCWFVRAEILRHLQPVDLSLNKYGWGIDLVVAAYSRLLGGFCVRDYSLTVKHPRRRGYPTSTAWQQMHLYLQTLDPLVVRVVKQLYEECLMLGQR